MATKTFGIKQSNLAEKIIETITRSSLKMTEKAAANNESLIVGDDNGGWKEVPAKELLKTFPKK